MELLDDATVTEVKKLSTQVRELSVDLARERARAAELEKQLAQSQSEAKAQAEAAAAAAQTPVQPSAEPAPAPTRSPPRRQPHADPRVGQLVVENSKLQNTLNKLRLILTRELGEAELAAALEAGYLPNADRVAGTWRGRQERLLRLESQLRTAKARIQELERGSADPRAPAPGRGPGSAGFTNPRRLAPIGDESDARVRSALNRHAADTQEQLRAAKAEIAETVAVAETADKRARAARARSDVLARQLSDVRTDLQQLVEKARRDDELISRLRSALATGGGAEPRGPEQAAVGADAVESILPIGVVQAEARQLAAAAQEAQERHTADLGRIAALEAAIGRLKSAVRAAGMGSREIDALEAAPAGECDVCGPELRQLRQRATEAEASVESARQLAADQVSAYEAVCAELARQLAAEDAAPASDAETALRRQCAELRRRVNELVVQTTLSQR